MTEVNKIVVAFVAVVLIATVVTGAVIYTNAGNATLEEQGAGTVVVNDVAEDAASEDAVVQTWTKIIIPRMIASAYAEEQLEKEYPAFEEKLPVKEANVLKADFAYGLGEITALKGYGAELQSFSLADQM